MFPSIRKASPPNIRFSLNPGSPSTNSPTRSANSSSYAIGGLSPPVPRGAAKRRPLSSSSVIASVCTTAGQRLEALTVWRAARAASGGPPSQSRLTRVREKLADDTACLLVGREGDRVIAMALAEPYREQHGAGAIRNHAGHVSMVFVDPEHWGRGIGGRLLDALHPEMAARSWMSSSLWTRATNERARRLYESRRYRETGDTQYLRRNDEILRYELQLDD
ncbi:MAG: GNAT family N-acetyltransferase [Solirubrobacterales bacterium]